MGRVVYEMGTSLDGYIEDRSGGFGFAEPDEEVHRAANEEARDVAAFLFGRRLFEVMEEPWAAVAASGGDHEVEDDFARIYLSTPRIVFSDTLAEVPEGVRLVRRSDARAEVERLKAEVDGELAIGGAALAASLADLLDEVRLFVAPVLVGGGTPFLPVDHQLRLRLVGHRVFSSGTVHARYEVVR